MSDPHRAPGGRPARRPARARWAPLLGGAVATAALLALYGRVEAPWFALGFVALVPWLLALDRAASWRQAAGAGAVMSAVFVVSVFPWFPGAVQRYADGSSPLLWGLLIVAAPALEPQFVTFALVRHVALRAGGAPAALRAAVAGACAYVGTELLVPKLFFDTLGQGLYPSLYLRQAADLAGVHGLTLLVLLVNEGILATRRRWVEAPVAGMDGGGGGWRRSRAVHIAAPLAGALSLVLAGFAYGALRVAEIEARSRTPGLVVGVVQANITGYDKLRAEKGAFEAVRLVLDAHRALSEEIRGRARPDLILWPETVYPTTFGSPRSEAGAAFDAEIAAVARGVPLVFGAYDVEGEREFNAAFFLTAAPDGRLSSSTYRKRMLFPLTEWVPEALESERLRRWLPWTGRWARGPGPRVIPMDLGGGRSITVLPLICYDVLFPELVAEGVRGGADLIVTLSNDSWFPDERAPRLHLISAAFRSVETRLPQVRATNSGISALIAPTGEILAATRWDERATLVGTLAGAGRATTLAMTLGPWLGPPLLAAAALLLLDGAARGRGAPDAQPGPPRPRAQRRRRART